MDLFIITMAGDGLATQGAKPSTAMVLTYFPKVFRPDQQ